MNLQEFAALKVGDKIENLMSDSYGIVTKTSDSGVTVQWVPSSMEFSYSGMASTAWMHWNRVVEAIEDRPDGIA